MKSVNDQYDPLTAAGPGHGLDHVPGYWQASAGDVQDDGVLAGESRADVAVIGGG